MPKLRFPEFRDAGEWVEKRLEDIADSENSSLALNKIDLKKKGYSVYGADGFVGYIDEYQQDERYISIVKDGAGIGRLNLCQPKSSILGTLTCIKSKNLRNFNLDWIYYQMNIIDFTLYNKGSGIPHIYFSDFKTKSINVPQSQEQQKIAACLTALDDLISAATERLDALKQHKQGLMQQLFPTEGETVPRLRFAEFREAGEWERKKLENIGEPLMCKRIFKSQTITNSKNAVPFYKIGTFGRIADSYISCELYNEYKNKYSFPNKGDILISASGTIGRLVVYNGEAAYFQDSNIVWLGHNEELVKNSFLFYCYSILNWQTSDGGIIKRLYNSDINNIKFCFPKAKKEQQKIAACLTALDDLISAQMQKIAKLKTHKRGLMQQLFPAVDETHR